MIQEISSSPRLKRFWMFALEYPTVMPRGGLGTHLQELATGLLEMNYVIDIFVPQPSENAIQLGENLTLNLCPMPDYPPLLANRLWRARNEAVFDLSMKMLKRGIIPQIIHCHDWYLFEAAARLRQLCNCAVIGTIHLSQAVYDRWGGSPTLTAIREETRMCLEADRILTVSNSMREAIADFYNLEKSKIYVVPNGITRSQESADIKYSSADKNIVYAGRIIPQKGVIDFIRSAELVIEAGKDVHYQIIGCNGGSYERSLREYCNNSNLLRNRIQFQPFMKQEELRAVYHTADLAIVPSCYEPFGYAALEAMLSGVCVIASDSGGLSEIIEDKVTGFLVPMIRDEDSAYSCDVDALAQTQIMVLDDDKKRLAAARNARTVALRDFSRSKMCAETSAHYSQVR